VDLEARIASWLRCGYADLPVDLALKPTLVLRDVLQMHQLVIGSDLSIYLFKLLIKSSSLWLTASLYTYWSRFSYASSPPTVTVDPTLIQSFSSFNVLARGLLGGHVISTQVGIVATCV
jgi:hypothetical protein